MRNYDYIQKFKELGFGMFVHFGAYSVLKKGEWDYNERKGNKESYWDLPYKFNPRKDWAIKLVKIAKKAGCKYITLTTRHHEGFSLYDTCGLNEFDTLHIGPKRDLVREFVDACNNENIVPFFYHTLLDWHEESYKNDFDKYIDYLISSIEILCKNYGKIGGFWFDGYWDKPNANWQFDRLYSTIRKYQEDAMIINNTGLSKLGEVSNPEIDSVTFERGKPFSLNQTDRPRAGEVCDGLYEHWGYCENDIGIKSVSYLIDELIDCRLCDCNFLLNSGPLPNGHIPLMDEATFLFLGKWIKVNKGFIYKAHSTKLEAIGAKVLFDGEYYYAITSGVNMSANPDVALKGTKKCVKILTDKKVVNAKYLDNMQNVEISKDNSFVMLPFEYGQAYLTRVVRFKLK